MRIFDTAVKAAQILLVEDNPGDAKLVEVNLRKLHAATALHIAPTAESALMWLEGAPECERHPDLILLDLNLPGMGGFDFLETIKADTRFSDIPVLVFTSSDSPADVQRAREMAADEYLVKPAMPADLAALLQGVEKRWLNRPPGAPEEPDLRPPEHAGRLLEAGTVRVLLVEDNAPLARLLELELRRVRGARFLFRHVESLETAVERLREEPFDIVLLDLSLPDSCGLDTVIAMRKRIPATLPIVVLTARIDEQIKQEVLGAGAAGFLVKGQAAPEQVAALIRRVVDGGA